MALTDAAGRFRSVNAAFGRLLGRRPADLVGTPIASLSRRDDVAGAQAVMYDLLDRVAETARFEDRYLRPDGSVVWVDMSIRSLTGPGGAVSGFLAQGLDITVRKQAELAADRHRHQLEEAQRMAGLGSFEHDPKTGLFSASHELCRILGLSREPGPMSPGWCALCTPRTVACSRRPQDAVWPKGYRWTWSTAWSWPTGPGVGRMSGPTGRPTRSTAGTGWSGRCLTSPVSSRRSRTSSTRRCTTSLPGYPTGCWSPTGCARAWPAPGALIAGWP